jgi:hypothetical protein
MAYAQARIRLRISHLAGKRGVEAVGFQGV